eukprot:2118527-Pleurochrysis_carterae.AAC.1
MDGLLNHLARGYIVISEPAVSSSASAEARIEQPSAAAENEVSVSVLKDSKTDVITVEAASAAVADTEHAASQLAAATAAASGTLDTASVHESHNVAPSQPVAAPSSPVPPQHVGTTLAPELSIAVPKGSETADSPPFPSPPSVDSIPDKASFVLAPAAVPAVAQSTPA